MRVRDERARESWRRQTEGLLSGPPEYERELALKYLDTAEKWADTIEEKWDWNGDDGSFAEVARTTYDTLMKDIPSTEFGGGTCNLCVGYLADTWEFGNRLRRWYKEARR